MANFYKIYWPLFLFVGIFALIVFVKILVKYKQQAKLKNSGIADILQMDGFQFEHYLATLFKESGYSVKVTASRGDFGADLILNKDGKKIGLQAKRYAKPVGVKAVQEIIAAATYYKTSESWVVATNSFTKSAKELAQAAGVKLIDKNKLIEMILKMNPAANKISSKTLNSIKPKDIRCKLCGGTMTVRSGKHGNFYGCNSYPQCNYTKKIGA